MYFPHSVLIHIAYLLIIRILPWPLTGLFAAVFTAVQSLYVYSVFVFTCNIVIIIIIITITIIKRYIRRVLLLLNFLIYFYGSIFLDIHVIFIDTLVFRFLMLMPFTFYGYLLVHGFVLFNVSF